MSDRFWQIWIDTGGTFTDGLAVDPDGRWHQAKVLSSSALRTSVVRIEGRRQVALDIPWSLPEDFFSNFDLVVMPGEGEASRVSRYDPKSRELFLETDVEVSVGSPIELRSKVEAPVLLAQLITQTPPSDPLPSMQMRLATTRGTNALLQRHGARTLLLVTKGFKDLLRIGTQQRPDLFDLNIQRPDPLPDSIVEVEERISSDGEILQPLQRAGLKAQLSRHAQAGFGSAAIALLNSYRNPQHEQQLETMLREAGFSDVSRSSVLAPSIDLLRRAQTTAIDAYLSPVVGEYLRSVAKATDGERHRLLVMTSTGSLLGHQGFHPKDSLLSGPAGGVVGSALEGERAGFSRVLSFDMGGTSTDVSRYDGRFDYRFEHEVAGVRLAAPALSIESVAAGGGSICWTQGGRPRVGPASAGADPGPACYGAGGPLTITDVNLLLGRLVPQRFSIPLAVDAARDRFVELRESIEAAGTTAPDDSAFLDGLLAIADERMADAIRRISLREGYDPTDYALLAFGGAGGQHACAIAQRLGIRTIVIPAAAGILSAVGLGAATIERFTERQILEPLDRVAPDLVNWVDQLQQEALDLLATEGIGSDGVAECRCLIELRFVGQDSTLVVELDRLENLTDDFRARYQALFAHVPRRAIEVVSLRAIARASGSAGMRRDDDQSAKPVDPGIASQRGFDGTNWVQLPVHDQNPISSGARIDGPALVTQEHSTVYVAAGWTLHRNPSGALQLDAAPSQGGTVHRGDAIEVELFGHRCETVAREMGEMLRRTAVSTNVKERQDYSCALLDRDGFLVVNAPHIPVHLGALGLCVRRLRDRITMESGDMIVTNHPAFGGSHLPDVTLVSPVFDGQEHLGYVASRAHHAEIGGIRPGSMPNDATNLSEEGVVLAPFALVREGAADWDRLERVLSASPYPTRALEDNLADLRAMVAANARGVTAFRALSRQLNPNQLATRLRQLRRRAERHVRSALSRLPDGEYNAIETLDDGTPLRVSIELRGDEATIDFEGSGPVHPGNLNATEAVVRSAVLYVLRLLVAEDLPLNEGLMDAITLRIPPGILNPTFPDQPDRCPAIVGGNVETSQRLVDVLLKALGLAACSQGTMNNVSFGQANFGYYETIGGGSGAGPGFHGASGVHTHMTNTRITDAEVLEHRYPVRLHRFELREGSGGQGLWRGGAGVIREFEFLEPMELSILSQHRRFGPYGLAGGHHGQPGRQTLVHADGRRTELDERAGADVAAGDRLIVETPGGGGYGQEAG